MIVHVDMDAFYASIEQRDNPQLKGRPVVVGGRSRRGVVSAASYEARVFGIHSAMPVFQARRLCPQAVFIPGRMSRYREVSREIMRFMNQITPLVEPVSIDEAYLDVSGCERMYGSAFDLGRRIKEGIRESVELTCSVGIAPLKFLAKIASDLNKPDGITIIEKEQVTGFIAGLPIEKVPGVGKKTRQTLRSLSIDTLGDVGRFSQGRLVQQLGQFGKRLYELANGIDSSRVVSLASAKSVSAESTLEHDTSDPALLRKELLRHAERVGRELRSSNLRAKTVSIKIKHHDFKQITRCMTLDRPLQNTRALYEAALQLFAGYELRAPVRLIGVGASGIVKAGTPIQRDLFEDPRGKTADWEKIDRAVDSINLQFGQGSVTRAALGEGRGECSPPLHKKSGSDSP